MYTHFTSTYPVYGTGDRQGIQYALKPTAKIRILSDIFTIFASWRTLKDKVIKRALKIFWLTIVSILAFVFAASLTIQLPQVQTFIAKRVINTLSEKIQGTISFEKIHFKPFTTFVLKNALIVDKNPTINPRNGAQVDTFFRAQYIIAKFSMEGLFRHGSIHLDKAFISNGHMNLVLENRPDLGDGDTTAENLTRISDLASRKRKKRRKVKKSCSI